MTPAFFQDVPLYASGLLTTVMVSFAGIANATVLGILLASALRSRYRLLSLLFLLYYGGPQFGLLLSPYAAGVVGLGLYGAGPFAEIFRAGLNAVPKGEREAAYMLGFTPWHCFFHVELPQALRLTLPPSVGQAINLVKESAVLSVITLGELTKVAGTISSITFAIVTPYLTVALLYWAIVEFLSRLGLYLERRFTMKGS
jgi:polar amino acid transport system permease protein